MNQPELVLEGSSSSPSVVQCANCGAEISGSYCSTCGQKVRTEHDLRLGHFLAHALHELTHFDSKIFRSLRALIARPGLLTTEFLAGREKRYMNPVQLFVIVNVLYFILVEFFPITTFTSPLEVQYSLQIYSPAIQPIVDKRIANSKLTHDQFAERYNETSAAEAKTLVICMVPLFAGVLALLYARKRRYYVEHLIFSLNFYALFLLVCSFGVLIAGSLVEILLEVSGVHLSPAEFDDLFTIVPGLMLAVYLFFALRRVYREGWVASVVKALCLTYSLLWILFAYRFMLFFTTMATMKG